MADIAELTARSHDGLAALLDGAGPGVWDAQSLCEGWRVRNVVAHMTMAVRLSPEQFGAEMEAAGGDFTILSNTVAERDGALPENELVAALRSPEMHRWQPPGGGAEGALNHVVIHALDITVPLGLAPAVPGEAVDSVLTRLADTGGAFGADPSGTRLEADDADWSRGEGELVRAPGGELVALLAGRILPDGRALPRA